MQAMQYEITLPADYDMGVIRRRVEARGAGTDHFEGLAIKAYGIREKGVNGSTVNQYAPFYLWNTVAGLGRFVFGPGFAHIRADFGRPAVRQWTGLAFGAGPDHQLVPRSAARLTTSIPPESFDRTIEDAHREADAASSVPGMHSVALLIDTVTWELVRYTLWSREAPEGSGDRYEVLHVSRPEPVK